MNAIVLSCAIDGLAWSHSEYAPSAFSSVAVTVGMILVVACLCVPVLASGQVLTGALIGTVKDERGGILSGATVRVSSRALIGGPATITSNEQGQIRFSALPPGTYRIEVELSGFAPYREGDRRRGNGVSYRNAQQRRRNAFRVRIPEEHSQSPLQHVRFAQSGTGNLTNLTVERHRQHISAFGSGNENLFLIDGTNFTCPCAGVSRAEPSVDVIQEVQVQSVGVSAEYGNIQGTVFNVLTKQGGDRFQYDASYYGQPLRSPASPSCGLSRTILPTRLKKR